MRNSFHRRPPTKAPITGADRVGVQGDLSAVLDKSRVEKEDPRVERPLQMIRSIRYVGDTEGATPAEAMSAKSHALYEYLMASARTELATTAEHSVSFADAMAYLDTPRADRVREYLDAISRTFVSYDFTEEDGTRRAASRIQLLQCEEVLLPTGEREIGYRMHPSVRRVILAATQYAHLEVAAFARFKCKYSARLYPKLAYVAGLDEQHPLSYKPEDLAEELGYVSKKEKFHWGHFENDCLKPAMGDMFGAEDGSTEAKVRRFTADYELRRSASRGRPVESIVFYVGRARKHIGEEQKPKVISLDRERIRKLFDSAGLDRATETPNEELLAQAAGRMKVGIVLIAQRWAATMSLAKEDPDVLVGLLGLLTGRQILETLASEGVGAAFTNWLNDWKEPMGINYRPGQEPVARPVEPAPTITPPLKAVADNDVDFYDASIIRVEFDDEIRTDRWIQKEVIDELQAAHMFSMGETKTLRIEWNGNGFLARKEITAPMMELTIRSLLMRHREIIDTVEYLA
ncbi:RepB family plasmid replication initiator protein [Sinorhizobium medicae]|nr:RepB family plasmid replication initiator protein [Sinorhizobium medicae]